MVRSNPPKLLQEIRREPSTGLGYRFFALHLLTVWGLALSNIFLGLTVVWSGWRRDRLHRPLLTYGTMGSIKLLAPLGLYVALLVASVALSYDRSVSVSDLREIIALSTLPLALLLVRGRRETGLILDLLIGLTAVLALFGIGQYFLTDFGGIDNRIPGPFSHYMTFSGILMVGCCLLFAKLATGEHRRRLMYWLLLAPTILALLLTLTRNTWVAVVMAAMVAILARSKRWVGAFTLGLVLVLALSAVAAPQLWSRARSMADLRDASNYDRLCMAYAGLHMVAERPLFGIGPGMVEERYPIYRHPTSQRREVAHLHNTLLHLSAERGLLSTAAYLWLMLAGLRLAYLGLRRGGGLAGPDASVHMGTFLTLLAFNVAGLFEANWRDTEVQRWVLFVMAMPLCLAGSTAPGTEESAEGEA